MKTRVRKNWNVEKVQEQRDRESSLLAASSGQRKPRGTKMEDAPEDSGEETNEDVSTQKTKNQN